MTSENFHRDNHYVPKLYLKNWTGANGKLWAYRLLVSHENVPPWKSVSPRGVAKHDHLYTRLVAADESDEVERWLDQEFETPAEEPIRKVLENRRLTPADWQRLIRFVAAQHARTPARLLEVLERWSGNMQDVLDSTVKNAVSKLEEAHRSQTAVESSPHPLGGYVPLRVTTEMQPEEEFGTIKVETIVGRGLWLFQIKQLLTSTLNILQQHRWTVLYPPEGIEWLTSDDPVIPLNYYAPGNYDFKGGWGNPGTEILLPLGPGHMLYTMVGKKPGYQKTVPQHQAEMMRAMIAEHAHRYVFASAPDSEVLALRPRIVDDAAVQQERQEWRNRHEDQTRAERDLMGLKAQESI